MAAKKQTAEKIDHVARLRSVLAAMGLRRATFVDDQFSPSFDDVWSRSRAAVATKGKELAQLWGKGRWDAESGDDDRPEAEKVWNARDLPGQVELLRQVLAATAEAMGATEVAADESFFKKSWPAECPMEELGPAKFTDDYIKETLIAKGPSILFLDLSFGSGDERGGVRLLRKVLTLDTNRSTVCVVFTRQSGATSADFWPSIATTDGFDAGDAVAISQGATKSIAVFEAELRRALLNGLAPELMNWGKGIVQSALTKALSTTKFEGDVLNAVVLQSSEKEGVHPVDTLFRLIDEEVRLERERVSAGETAQKDFAALKTKLEALAQIAPPDDVEPALTSRVRKLMRSHLYRTQIGPPEWPSPMWLGDIWDVTMQDGSDTTEQYVLISQPCDIILRSDGSRSQEWAILVPLKKDKGKHPELVVELKYFDDAKYEHRYAYLKRARVANASVLDTVATIGPTIKRSEIQALRERGHVHASVKNRTSQLLDWIAAMPADPSAAPLLALFVGPGPAAKLTNTAEAVDFHAKRTGRIEPELARSLLQRYGNFVSRNALPHDFAEFEVKGA